MNELMFERENTRFLMTPDGAFRLEREGGIQVSGLATGAPAGAKQPLYARQAGGLFALALDLTERFPGAKRAVRYCFGLLPHMLFLVDTVSSAEPLRQNSEFLLENAGGGLNVHIYNPHRLVFRQGKTALKLFDFASFADGQPEDAALHIGGREILEESEFSPDSAFRFCWQGHRAGRELVRIHTFALDAEEKIRGWHVLETPDGFYRIEPPSKAGALELKLEKNAFLLRHDDHLEQFERFESEECI